jgi:hypothetical protein
MIRTLRNHSYRSFCSVLASFTLVALAACGGGGGGGGATSPVSAVVPAGSGARAIQMIGTWEIRNVIVVESGGASPLTPLNGTQVVISGDGIVSIGGFSTKQADLETLLGAPLDTYVNQQDGRRLFYGLTLDQRATGFTREVVGLAGGSIDDATIAVEQFNSSTNAAGVESFVRARYTLARIAPSILIPADAVAPADGEPKPTMEQLLQQRFGDKAAK